MQTANVCKKVCQNESPAYDSDSIFKLDMTLLNLEPFCEHKHELNLESKPFEF